MNELIMNCMGGDFFVVVVVVTGQRESPFSSPVFWIRDLGYRERNDCDLPLHAGVLGSSLLRWTMARLVRNQRD